MKKLSLIIVLMLCTVFILLGKQGIKTNKMTVVNQPVAGTIGYYIRSGIHDVTLYDWQQYIKFADLHLK